jgi:sulfide:quinone oxidoreductase
MDQKYMDSMLSKMDSELKEKGLSRRDAFKLAGLTGAGFMLNPTESEAVTVANASSAKGKILIVGGGLAGMSTAARLTNALSNPDITVVEPEALSTSYQPGQTFVASGVWDESDIAYKRDDFVPSGVKLVNDKVVEFDPANNQVKTAKGETISYDFMIVATGLKLDFGRIKGLEEAGEAYATGDNAKLLSVLGDSGVCSLYTAQGATKTWEQMQKYIAQAKSGKQTKFVYTHPNTPIKCGGAPKKIVYLTNSRLKEAGARENAELTFYPNGGKMFGVPEYHEAIKAQFEREGFKWHYAHNLVEVDMANKIAVFDHHWTEKGEYDKDLEEYSTVTKHERVEVPYDFLHITPPMKAPDEVGKSPIGSDKGWVPVNKETLQHVKFNNVFALGDIAAVPMGKTGGSVRKQYKVLVDNVIAAMEAKELPSKYDGYTVCPLITSIGTVMLAEFNWTKKPTPSFPLDPTVERWIWWLLKAYALKSMTINGMLSGRA